MYSLLDAQQEVAFSLHEELHDIYLELYASKHKSFTFEGKGYDDNQLVSRRRELHGIMSVSSKIREDEEYKITKKFYHYKKLDFRYRKYSTTTWFREDGSRMSRALHLMQPKLMTFDRFCYVLASLASASGFDKASRADRMTYAVEMLPVWMEYAKDPIGTADVWTDEEIIDNPWEFMSILLEVKRFTEAEDKDNFYSGIPTFLDAKNSGIAFLSVLARDIKGMKATSLLPTDGNEDDAYMVIVNAIKPQLEDVEKGEAIWKALRDDMEAICTDYRLAKESGCEVAIADAMEVKAEFFNAYKENIALSARYFWSRFEDKQLRKVVKRPTLAIPYGSGPTTNSEQSILSDFRNKTAFDGINVYFTDWLAVEIDRAFATEFKRAKRLMVKYQAKAKKMAKANKDFGFVVPFTNVLFEQKYRNGWTEPVLVYFNGRRFRPRVRISTNGAIKYNEARLGASANATHAMDATLLNYFISTFGQDVFAIHDAFGTTDPHRAWYRLRLCFKNLVSTDILKDRVGITYFKRGKATLDGIMTSESCFA